MDISFCGKPVSNIEWFKKLISLFIIDLWGFFIFMDTIPLLTVKLYWILLIFLRILNNFSLFMQWTRLNTDLFNVKASLNSWNEFSFVVMYYVFHVSLILIYKYSRYLQLCEKNWPIILLKYSCQILVSRIYWLGVPVMA